MKLCYNQSKLLEKRGASHVRCNCCRRWPSRKYRRKGTG
ncbi:hypothetical protein D1641_03805 [Colidextribacter sp. OB.20]|nr:hypothetical protein [Colidextribacter sp. OB.20]